MMKGLLKYLSVVLGFLLLILIRNNMSLDGIAVYVNDELEDSIPKKGEAMYVKSVCDNDGKASWDNDNWGLLVTNMSKKTKCNLYFYSGDTVFNFDYTGSEQVFTVPISGTYKLETWGAQGGNAYSNLASGGFGGYSVGYIFLDKSLKIIIAIGQQGVSAINYDTIYSGSYNGGGGSHSNFDTLWGAGGGATHIAMKSGLLSTLENYKSDILIVSGGGGGAGWLYGKYSTEKSERTLPNTGGSGGGYIGSSGSTHSVSVSNGGTQENGGASGDIDYDKNEAISGFGLGATPLTSNFGSGGGGGYYGGGSSFTYGAAGAGGSGYIGNPLLKDKTMYCYNCEESSDESTKTISTTCSEEMPTENCSKKGNGYARITLVSIDE